jgi:pimeloyl-ACP methyl ester carboxylesterase
MAATGPAVHDTGRGPALLFLHAFPLDASQWDHQVAAISGEHRCLRPDMWGCGSSPAPPNDEPSLDAYARGVLTALDDRGVDRFGVVGLSLGGYVAFALLRIGAPRITSVTLCNTRAGADAASVRADRLALADRVLDAGSVEALVEPNVERLLSAHSRTEAHVTDPLRARIRRCTPAGIAYAARAMAARPDSSALLPAIAVPTLVIAGREDAVIPLAEMQAMAGEIPGAQLVEMSCGHLSNLEDPHGFTAHLQRFLATPIIATS